MPKNISTCAKMSIVRSSLLLGFLFFLTIAATFLSPGLATTYASAVPSQPVLTSTIPPWVRVPANEQLVLSATVKLGYQVYRCSVQGGWVLQGPLALLAGPHAENILHSFGPRWQLNNGSTIQAQSIAAAPHFPSIPMRLFKVTSHSGNASWLTHVNYVQQLNTSGGGLSTHCNAATDRGFVSVPYTAIYQFWQPR